MVYIKRNQDGRITALSDELEPLDTTQRAEWTFARGDDPEVLAFFRSLSDATNPVGATDAGLIRVVEDLVDLLIERGVIRFTDLPSAAQAKLAERRHWRTEMRKLSLLDDDNSSVI